MAVIAGQGKCKSEPENSTRRSNLYSRRLRGDVAGFHLPVKKVDARAAFASRNDQSVPDTIVQ